MFSEYQEKYLADPKSGPCPCFQKRDTFLFKRIPERDDFYHLTNGRLCGEAWDAATSGGNWLPPALLVIPLSTAGMKQDLFSNFKVKKAPFSFSNC